MSLVGQTVWVVGGVGALGRGITRSLLQAGATVIVNSRSPERLSRIAEDLQHPERLVMVQGRLLGESATETVSKALPKDSSVLNHVVAHGAVRYWTTERAGCDETYSLNQTTTGSLLEQSPQEFDANASLLASLHFSAAQQLMPRLGGKSSSYTFVTGDGGGHPSNRRSAMGEINSHHVWGLSAALRQELSTTASDIVCQELRVGLEAISSSTSSLSQDIGDLCAGLLAAAAVGSTNNGRLFHVDSQRKLVDLLNEYRAVDDKTLEPLPSFAEFVGSL